MAALMQQLGVAPPPPPQAATSEEPETPGEPENE